MLVPLNINIPGGDIIINTSNCNNVYFGVGLNNENGIITINEVKTARLKLSTDKHDIIMAVNANVNDFNTIQSDNGFCIRIKVVGINIDMLVVNDSVITNS
jgi:hypothetical protein